MQRFCRDRRVHRDLCPVCLAAMPNADRFPYPNPPGALKRLGLIWKPERFQGWAKRRRYFEGWYFKCIASGEDHALAFIPGMALDEHGEGHAFVQVLDGIGLTSTYHRFPIEAFQPTADRFAVAVGDNRFSAEGLELDLPDWKGRLDIVGRVPWPVKPLSPGIMGWYAFVPFMECYHGIVSMDSRLRGSLEFQGGQTARPGLLAGTSVDFDGGRAYLEKDWGRSFPSSWIWMQSNHFDREACSLKLSVARIPWMGSSFVGFIAGLWYEGRLHRFTTYTGARLEHAAVHDERVEVVLADRKKRLTVTALRSDGGDLVSPVQGGMEGRVNETLTARLQVRLEVGKDCIFEGQGRMAGLEVAGPYQELLTETA